MLSQNKFVAALVKARSLTSLTQTLACQTKQTQSQHKPQTQPAPRCDDCTSSQQHTLCMSRHVGQLGAACGFVGNVCNARLRASVGQQPHSAFTLPDCSLQGSENKPAPTSGMHTAPSHPVLLTTVLAFETGKRAVCLPRWRP